MNDYLSVKEFSAAAGVSTQTIYKQLEKRLAPYVKESGGKKYISRAALEEFYGMQPNATEELQKDNQDSTEIQPDSTEVQPDSTEELPTQQPENEAEGQQAGQIRSDNQRELDLLQELIKTIQKELEEKNKQLEIKDKQIQDLSDRLAEAMQLTRGQQYIAAADKKKELMDKETDTVELTPAAVSDSTDQKFEEDQPKKKKGFWAKIFGF